MLRGHRTNRPPDEGPLRRKAAATIAVRAAFILAIAAAAACGLGRTGLASSPPGPTPRGGNPDRPQFLRLASPSDTVRPEVTFLQQVPVIDGRLDPGLESLPERTWAMAYKSRTSNPLPSPRYRLAYGTDFLYLYIESQADSLTFRDRAFQNGDGFAFVLGRPRPGGAPTDEFYVLACSAVRDPSQEWARTIYWYYNVKNLFVPAGPGTRLEFSADKGRIRFELLLPWADIPPYHPWITGDLAFHLAFTQAAGGTERNRFVDLGDEVGAEMRTRRYLRLRFAAPSTAGGPQVYVAPARRNLFPADSLAIDVATVSAAGGTVPIILRLLTGEGERLVGKRRDLAVSSGVFHTSLMLPIGPRPAGAYRFQWTGGDARFRGETGLSLLSPFDSAAVRTELDSFSGRIPDGSRRTLLFLSQELANDLRELRPYETCGPLRIRLSEFTEAMARARTGTDPLAPRPGLQRRAFLSAIDSTLQPYTVRVPEGFDPARRYPLLVYLHGSASDETNLNGVTFLGGGRCIEIGPRGRGFSNAYASRNAQIDISEAIQDVMRWFPCDSTRIILTGFSMGGYGVYRTFSENPRRYRALAVFSGGPDLGRRFAFGENPPDYSQEKNLAVFRGVPIFIFHGRRDLNVPFAGTADLVEKLKAAGAAVEFADDPQKGHETPGGATIEAYHRWLEGVLGGVTSPNPANENIPLRSDRHQ